MSRFTLFFSFVMLGAMLMSATSSVQGVIKKNYKFLIGEYELIAVKDEGKTLTPNVPGRITMTVTKKDKLMIYKDGSLVDQYDFNSLRSPFPTETEKYVLFNKENENYPLFFKGDSVIQFIYPNEFSENYFRKINTK
jgi:hypothetical protein